MRETEIKRTPSNIAGSGNWIKTYSCLAVFAFFLFHISSFGQILPADSATELNEIRITDQQNMKPELYSGIRPGNPMILSTTDNLNFINGISALQGAGNTAKLSYRGIGARSQYTTSRSLLYFNEIPLTSAEGFSTFEDIYPGWISGAKLPLNDPQSFTNKAFYPNALGSVLLMQSISDRPALRENEATYKFTTGSFGLLQNSFSGRVSSETYRGFAGYENTSYDGWRENSRLKRQSLFMDHQWKLRNDHRIKFLVYGIKNYSQIPSSIDINDFRDSPEKAAANWRDIEGYEEYEKVTTGITLDNFAREKAFKYSATAFFHFRDAFEPRPFNILQENTSSGGMRFKARRDSIFLFQRQGSIQGFAEYIYDHHRAETFENEYDSILNEPNNVGVPIESTLFQSHRVNAGLALSSSFSEVLFYNIGLKTYYQYQDINQSDVLDVPLILAPSVSLSYQSRDQEDKLYLNVYRSYGIPSIEENLDPDGSLNSGLKPEKSWTAELEWQKKLMKKWPLGITLYHTRVENLIIPKVIAEDQVIASNSGSSLHSGIELSFSPVFTMGKHRIEPSVGGYFGYFRYQSFSDTTGSYSGNKLPGFPDRQINLSAVYHYDRKWTFGILSNYTGGYYVDDENTVQTQSYLLLQSWVQANITWRRWHLTPRIGIRNIGDINYAAMTVVNNTAFGNAQPRYYYPGDPLNWFASVKVSYSFR